MAFYLERVDKKGDPPVPLAEGATSLGRHPRNTVALSAEDRCVSGYHAIIYATSGKLLLQDMQSTNGTYVNGGKVQDERAIKEGDEIGLGFSGPRFRVVGDAVAAGTADTPRPGVNPNPVNDNLPAPSPITVVPPPVTQTNVPMVAVKMPGVPKRIVYAIAGVVMLAALITLIVFTSGADDGGRTKSSSPSLPKKTFFKHNAEASSDDMDDDHDLGRAGALMDRGTVEARIDAILRRFGERDYQMPPEMQERVEFYLNEFTTGKKHTITRFMERRNIYFPMIRRVFIEKNIPLDLAYVSVLESGLDPHAISHAGAKGLWQFMPNTARAYGLEVSDRRDERTDPEKATYAAAAYFKDLIAIFGSKSAVMLCMAAYNAGESRIINALKRIDDPVKNRDFWYLYKRKWLAEETNEYIPQILALIIISEHPEEYGFE